MKKIPFYSPLTPQLLTITTSDYITWSVQNGMADTAGVTEQNVCIHDN